MRPQAVLWHLLRGEPHRAERRFVVRHRGGGGRGARKLSDDDVRAIRAEPSSYGYRKRLARRFNISVKYVDHLRDGSARAGVL